MHTPYDSRLFAPLYGTDAMRAWWSDTALVQSWLDVEVALASAQAALGIIPEDAASAIADVAHIDNVDMDQLAKKTAVVGMPIQPLISALSAQGGPLVQQYLHWGGTTQDVLDTGQALRLAGSLRLLDSELRGLLGQLVAMADQHRRTVMVARTNSQDALPTTWGLQVSTYATELARHLHRLHQLRDRACMGMFGGAVGTLASSDGQGRAVRDHMLRSLGLSSAPGAWNASQDGITEVLLWTGLVHGTLGRIANDVEMQGRTSVGELAEGEGGGGSSTMPHKGNPRACNAIQGFTRVGTTLAGGAYALMDQVDVRAASMRAVSWTLVPEAMLGLSASLDRARGLVEHLVVDADAMRANFAHSRNFVMSESVMMHLAQILGREPAYSLVKRALAAHDDGRSSLATVLSRSEAVTEHMDPDALARACDPTAYLGETDALIDEALAAARDALALPELA